MELNERTPEAKTAYAEGWAAEFRTYDTPGRGCFRITEVPYRSIERLPVADDADQA